MKRAATALVLGCALAACEPTAESREPLPVGPPPPVVDLSGLEARFRSLRGKPVLVNFWAMWCKPCVAELPELVEVARTFRAAGGEVLGVAMDTSARGFTVDGVLAKMPAFLAQHRVDYPIVIFDDEDPLAVSRGFDLSGALPETIAIDTQGEIVAHHEGQATRAELEALADKARGR